MVRENVLRTRYEEAFAEVHEVSLTAIAFLILFFACVIGALFTPVMGLIGYVIHYCIGPEGMWFGDPLRQIGIRYSMVLAAATLIGAILNRSKSQRSGPLLVREEKLAIAFLAYIVLYSLIRPPMIQRLGVDPVWLKMIKVLLMATAITHVCTNIKRVRVFIWTCLFGCAFLGYYIFANVGYLYKGRVEGIGGPDFREANGLAAFLLAFLPLAGVMFLTSRWKGKIFAAVAGVLSVNGIIATRSRGAIVAAGIVAVVAVLRAPRKYRLKIGAGLLVASCGAYALTDPGFWGRAETIQAEDGERDASAQGRIDTWKATLMMSKDHPFGVGPDNFDARIGSYDSRFEGRDAHSTYFLAIGELGWMGLSLFLLVSAAGIRTLWKCARIRRVSAKAFTQQSTQLALVSYALMLGLIAILAAGLTVSRLYTEMQWWFLLFPAMAARVGESLQPQEENESTDAPVGSLATS